ncbi:hypothetical protein PAERUG_E8_London_17_VIM_2_04_13_02950 [Pseudomonas aeruginosa]|nr:hypothetical protein BN889_05311 [Pseudomonas aeruginosa PA38182]CRN66485.1 hypothetical protein PAERUG_P17_North_West_14_VIM_2_03_10_02458 [Pseudomonas aeruginosa]CRO47588.1 hypothetical protein PAERUG_E8_London_17_VIM_2_04_13_02950 [Pseudomonas aeruginosa]CRO70084.1 hypothetical protein PAERUG_P1_London_28_IMP_1_04_05_02179 [Pseudomonas aeruginosa]CRP40606.1 hypothetical protein PAERUG_P2_London_28_IMP_1_06_05_02712 [Pseudomonas aeruginosa]
MALWVVAEDHTRVEDAARVEQALELPHQAIGVLAPLQLDERRHVAPGAMLGLQRAAVLHRHQVRHVVHERRVAGDLLGRVEALGEDEVQVALQRVAEEDRLIVAVLVEQLDQAVDSLGQSFDGEGDVLDNHRGAGLAHRADSREGVLADAPELVVDRRVFAEVDLLLQRIFGDGGHDPPELFVQQRAARRAGLDEQGAGTGGKTLHPFRHALHVLNRAQAAPIEQFHRRDRLALEHRDRRAAGFHRGENQQRRGLVRVFRDGVVGHRADEAEGALGADHQVGEDVQRLVVVDQRVQRQAGGVLQPVLVADLRGQFGVGAGLAAEFGEPFQQLAVAGAEGRDAGRVLAVQTGAVGQQQAQAGEGVVAVLRGAAAHAAGVVGDDAADLAGVDRGRVGTDLAAERRQPGVRLGADDTRLQADLRAVGADFPAVPVVAEDEQHRVADGLAGEAGAGGAEGHRDLLAVGDG